MSTLIFIRHGETDLAGRFCGHVDPSLNDEGNRQAALIAEEAGSLGVRHIYASDLLRAQQTARCIGQRLNLAVELHTGLREIGFGAWEGLNWTEIEERWPVEARVWIEEFPHRATPEGESYAEFTSRVDACFAGLAATAGEPTIIVSHRGVILYALVRFFGFAEAHARELTAPYGAKIAVEVELGKGIL